MSDDLTASIALQMEPLPGPADGGDLQVYADQLTGYLATQLSRFTDGRGADVFLALSVKRGDEHAGSEFRSGHYCKPDPVGAVPTEPAGEPR